MLNFIEGSITYLFILLFIYTFSRLKVNAKKYGFLSLGYFCIDLSDSAYGCNIHYCCKYFHEGSAENRSVHNGDAPGN